MSYTTSIIRPNALTEILFLVILTVCLVTRSSAGAFVKIHLNNRTEIISEKIILGEILWKIKD